MGNANRFVRAALLPLGVLALLLLMYLLPDLYWDGRRLRRVDLLGDVRVKPDRKADLPDLAAATMTDSLTLPDSIGEMEEETMFIRSNPIRVDTTAIVDYSDSTAHGMSAFYWALRKLESEDGGSPVRIAYFGDSFVEADILTADLRAKLQSQFGGCGVGFIPIASPLSGYRPTVKQSFSGWDSRNATSTHDFDPRQQGLSGQYSLAETGATVQVGGVRKYAPHIDTCSVAAIVFSAPEPVRLSMQVNGEDTVVQTFAAAEGLQQMSARGRIGKISWTVEQVDTAVFYGIVMDDTTGVVVDNFSLRSNSGLELGTVPEATMERFAAWRPYDLIILHYGLNVASEEPSNFYGYIAGMREVIGLLKTCFPQAAILIVSVSDRDYRTEEGEIETLPGIISLVKCQQRLAKAESVAFWNLFRSMGGEKSMTTLVDSDPPMANTDYTHINFRGGRHIASLLFDALMQGKKEYDEAYEAARQTKEDDNEQ